MLKHERLLFQPTVWNSSPVVVWMWSLIANFFRQGFQSMLHQSDSIWVKSRLWMTTEHLPVDWPSFSSLLTMDSPPLDTTLNSPFTLYHSATNHRTDHLRLFLLALCVQDSLNCFCWWASQTVDKWTGPCVLGVAVGITPQQGWFWAAPVYCAVISSTVSQKVCWDLPIAIYFLMSLFSPSVFLFFFFLTPRKGKGSNWCSHEES